MLDVEDFLKTRRRHGVRRFRTRHPHGRRRPRPGWTKNSRSPPGCDRRSNIWAPIVMKRGTEYPQHSYSSSAAGSNPTSRLGRSPVTKKKKSRSKAPKRCPKRPGRPGAHRRRQQTAPLVDGVLVDTAPALRPPRRPKTTSRSAAPTSSATGSRIASTSCRSMTGRWTRGKWAATNHAVRTMKSRSHQPDSRKTLTGLRNRCCAPDAIDSLGQQMGQHAPQIPADSSRSRSCENRSRTRPTVPSRVGGPRS